MILFADYCFGTLAAPITTGDTTLTFTLGSGSSPVPAAGGSDIFYATIVDAASYANGTIPPTSREVVKVTNVAGSTWAIVRGVTTTPTAFAAGASISVRVTAQSLTDLAVSGPTGPTGPGAGTSGFSGYSGQSGFSGFSGASGFSGYSGQSGFSGFSGLIGPTGPGVGTSGFSGFSGTAGPTGPGVGTSGFSGFIGTSGYSGRSGFSGFSGSPGSTGSAGSAGTSGFSGFSGKSGYSGFSGTAGSAGGSGFSGFSGKSGYSGFSGSIGGSDTQVQFNNAGVGAGDSRLTFNSTTKVTTGQFAIDSNAINAQTGTSYTLIAADNGKIITLNNASSITLTVPSGLSAGFNCMLIRLGAGVVSVVGSGTTINSAGGLTTIGTQHGAASLVSYVANVFNLSGNLS